MASLEELRERFSAHQAALRRWTEWIPHTPHPKQAEFLALSCREAMYGGAAGGGKSDALLMAALQYVDHPNYSALILRRSFRDLNQADAIMTRSQSWLRGTRARWNGNDYRWTFPSGATLTFGYLKTLTDKYQYQGTAFQYVGWDELTQFPEQDYRYLFSRLRRLEGSTVPVRMRAATNPGGIGHEWVRRRFIEPGAAHRVFVPARLDDNPSLDKTEYLEALAELDATTRAQLEKGVWVRDAEGLVYHFSDERNVVDAAPDCPNKLLALDFGVTAPTSFNILGWRDHDPTVYVLRSWKVRDLAPSEAAEEVIRLDEQHRFHVIVGDLGGLGKAFSQEARKRFHVPIEPAEKQNKLGYIALFNGDMEHARIKVVRSTCEPLIREWCELPWDEKRAKEAGGFDNHCADGVLYGWRRATAYLERPKPAPKTAAERVAAEEKRYEEVVDEELEADDERERTAKSAWWR